MVPLRGVVVVFAATVNDTVPLPEPLAVVTVIHDAPLVALQVHPVPAVIENEPLPLDAGRDCDVGAMTYEHDVVGAGCVTETT